MRNEEDLVRDVARQCELGETIDTYSALCPGMKQRSIAYDHVMDQTLFFMDKEGSDAKEQALRDLLKDCKAQMRRPH